MPDEAHIPVFDRQVVDHGADDLSGTAAWIKLDEGRQTILRDQLVAHRRVIGPYPRADDRPVKRLALLHKPMQIPSLMRPVKVAKSDMDDTGCKPRSIITRPVDPGSQIGQVCIAQSYC